VGCAFLIVQAMLGIFADAPAQALRIERPMLPDWLRWIRVEGLRVGDATVTLRFEQDRAVRASPWLEQRGRLGVTMATGE
jgi:hypothetical protein